MKDTKIIFRIVLNSPDKTNSTTCIYSIVLISLEMACTTNSNLSLFRQSDLQLFSLESDTQRQTILGPASVPQSFPNKEEVNVAWSLYKDEMAKQNINTSDVFLKKQLVPSPQEESYYKQVYERKKTSKTFRRKVKRLLSFLKFWVYISRHKRAGSVILDK